MTEKEKMLAGEVYSAVDTELLKELNKREGITEVIVTHDPGVAEKTNRIIRIADGVIS